MTNDQELPRAKTTNKSSFFAIFLVTICFLILTLVVAGVIYGGISFRNQIFRLREHQAHQQHQIAAMQSALESLTLPAEKRSRVLAQAEYLTRLANFSLSFERNVPVVVNLLKTADQQLSSLADPTLTSVRQSLANDIEALQAVPKVDLAGLIMRINAISQQINQLPIIPSQLKKPIMPAITTPPPPESFWKRGLEATGRALKNVVVVRHLEQPVEPLLPPELQTYLILNIQLKLSQAQWAALHQQPEIYQQSLQQAILWIRQYFVQNDNLTQNVLENLAELQKVNIKPPVPDISNSLNLLRHELEKAALKIP